MRNRIESLPDFLFWSLQQELEKKPLPKKLFGVLALLATIALTTGLLILWVPPSRSIFNLWAAFWFIISLRFISRYPH